MTNPILDLSRNDLMLLADLLRAGRLAPPDFRGPVSFANVPVYVPIMMQPQIQPGENLIEVRGDNMMTAVGRLREGRTAPRDQSTTGGFDDGIRPRRRSFQGVGER